MSFNTYCSIHWPYFYGPVKRISPKVFVKAHLCYTPLLDEGSALLGMQCICQNQHQYQGWGSTNAK